MKARFKRGWWRTYGTLTPGNVYRVIGIEGDDLRIFDDLGDPVLFVPQAFDIVEPAEPIDWIREHGDEGELYAYPAELGKPGFFESWHDGDARARSRLAWHVREICWREANGVEESANTYLRVQWTHAENDSPTLLYSELDEDRWEVRKVEVFADGRMTYAEARTQSGHSRLGEVPVPPLDQIAADPQFEPVAISRAEFERIWDKVAYSDDDAGDRPP
jgi:hypothetical protein